MPSSSPTRNQLNFISRLIGENPDRKKAMEKFLSESGKKSTEELSVPEASKLIDELRKIVPKWEEGKATGKPLATGKQIAFLTNLQNSEQRIAAAREFLKAHGKDSLNLLNMDEASELIEKLKSMAVEKGADNSGIPVSQKQIKYIESLQKSEDKKEIARLFMVKLKKKTVDELNRKKPASSSTC
ncbi:MAG: hypothetical protein AMDU1_APLC00061G0002 [Thermoplasmatales archaeon A-plasma]|nr:MAG: hypothetical protein AMDU1_APLC00061G0002 [Thermoplasmatales archaeon A-plasma]